MFAEPPPRLDEIELLPVHAKGELAPDHWWRPSSPPARRDLWRDHALEVLTLALPLALALVYQTIIAAPRYVSESEFMVRAIQTSEMGNLATLLQDQKVTRASDETYAVSEYLVSRDAVETLRAADGLADMLSRPQGDFVNRFPNPLSGTSREALWRHFQDFVDLKISADTGIARLRTLAFTPQDAVSLNRALLRNAEAFVNRLNDRVFHDTLASAEREVEAQKTKFAEVESRLTAFRNASNVLDPNKEVADGLSRIGALMTRLSKSESDLEQATTLTPRSPQIAALTSEVAAVRDQIAEERQRLSGQQDSLATKFVGFDRLMLDRTLASKQLETALAQFDRARQDAERQQFYLQTIVTPAAPDQPAYPRRFWNLMLIAGFSFAAYSILRAILKNLREHMP